MMSQPPDHKPQQPAPPPGFSSAVIASMTWRMLLTALMLAFCLNVIRWVQNSMQAPANFPTSSLVITNLGALLVMVATLAADEAIRRGVSAWLACLIALGTASVFTALGQWYIRAWLHLYTSVNKPGVPLPVQRTQMIFVACDVVVFGGFAMLAYVNHRGAQRILDGVRSAELERVLIERRLTESRLATARAQIDPNALFLSLEEIRCCYSQASPDADRKLDELILRLQTAVTGSGAAMGSEGT